MLVIFVDTSVELSRYLALKFIDVEFYIHLLVNIVFDDSTTASIVKYLTRYLSASRGDIYI